MLKDIKMRYVYLIVLTLLLTACSNDFVPTPVPEEIHTVVYTNSTARENIILRITNNDLRIQLTRQNKSGVMSNRYGTATPNNYNIMATDLEQANFMKVKSISGRGNPNAQERLVIETHAATYTFTQDRNTRFPPGIDEIAKLLPSLFPVR